MRELSFGRNVPPVTMMVAPGWSASSFATSSELVTIAMSARFLGKSVGQRGDGRPGVHDDGFAVADHRRGKLGDGGLLLAAQGSVDVHRPLIAAGTHRDGAAADAAQDLASFQIKQIGAHGDGRNAKRVGKLGDVGPACCIQLVHNLLCLSVAFKEGM